MFASSRSIPRFLYKSPFIEKDMIRIKDFIFKRKQSSSFLTEGYQPTTKELLDSSNLGYQSPGTKRKHIDPARVLPVLNASVILSPGQYCKGYSKSGMLAAQKLVDGRREFEEVLAKELSGNNQANKKGDTRKLYALIGHGVPNSLFEYFISTGREWLRCQNPVISSSTNNAHVKKPVCSKRQSDPANSAINLSLRNIPNSTMFDQERILKTNCSGETSLIQWPSEWNHDLELFMVAMNRIGSRLSSIAMKPKKEKPVTQNLALDDVAVGSVVVPSELEKWNVSIRKGEVLPFSLLPLSRNANLVLTVEWLRNSIDSWTVVLRLQDDLIDRHAAAQGLIRDPVSFVFEGVYVAS